MKIVWIASYPKSGNTLVRLLLHNYLYGETDNTDLIDDRIPGLHRLLAENRTVDLDGSGIKLIKSHFLFSKRHPYAEHTAAFIYILRNPRDVLLSNARYLGADSSDREQRHFADRFIEQLGVPRWREMGMGTWPQHIGSWLSATAKVPHIFVKYEDLRGATENRLADMIQMLGETTDPERLRAAVASSTIERARDHEIREKKHGRGRVFNPLPGGASFVGQGCMGQSLEKIGPDVDTRFDDRFGQYLRLVGYD